MKYMLFLASIVVTLTIYQVTGLRCYSCSSSFGNKSGRRNFNCVNNLTAIPTVRCSRGYYCLTSYTVQDGIVTYLRRTCQNPTSDYNQNTMVAPTLNGCTSTHSKYSSPDSTTCYFHCTTDKCNKHSPGTIQQCPDACPTTCNKLTGECSNSLRCVQCTSEGEENCEQKSEATPCPRSSYNFCASTRTSVMNLDKQIVHTTVTKSCTSFTAYYRIPTQPCRFRSTTSTTRINRFIKYSCGSFCSTNGCNVKVPGAVTPIPNENQLRCVVCSQIGDAGRCRTLTQLSQCQPNAAYCKATVTYYVSPLKTLYGRPVYQLATLVRECATDPVESQCTTADMSNSNLKFVTCQETCQKNGCNTGWPNRPKCGQCDARNASFSSRQFESCRLTPSAPRQCSNPVYQYCTTISNNTDSNPHYPRIVKRGCSVTNLEERCFDIPVSRGSGIVHHCQSSCNTDGCNRDPVQ